VFSGVKLRRQSRVGQPKFGLEGPRRGPDGITVNAILVSKAHEAVRANTADRRRLRLRSKSG
jgi:hypothetical protein